MWPIPKPDTWWARKGERERKNIRLSDECTQANGIGNYVYNSNKLWLLKLSINGKNTSNRFIKIIITCDQWFWRCQITTELYIWDWLMTYIYKIYLSARNKVFNIVNNVSHLTMFILSFLKLAHWLLGDLAIFINCKWQQTSARMPSWLSCPLYSAVVRGDYVQMDRLELRLAKDDYAGGRCTAEAAVQVICGLTILDCENSLGVQLCTKCEHPRQPTPDMQLGS